MVTVTLNVNSEKRTAAVAWNRSDDSFAVGSAQWLHGKLFVRE